MEKLEKNGIDKIKKGGILNGKIGVSIFGWDIHLHSYLKFHHKMIGKRR